RKLLPLLVTVLLVLSVSTGCTTTEVSEEPDLFRDTLISMIPALPVVPSMPELKWTYQDGMYCLDEQNVDLLLDYGENTLPNFRWQLEQYRRKLEIVLESL
ncbi:MAG: hypothetical protein J5891_06760, partial [Spirochaetales bacterium]|nr:hypothetical protein [Spirochaetales bacterium]